MAVLRRGRRNDPAAVRALQEILKTAGLYSGPVDGKFGRGTEAAVRAFQERAGIGVDGAVGPQTFNAMNTAGGDPVVENIPLPRPKPRYEDASLTTDLDALATAIAANKAAIPAGAAGGSGQKGKVGEPPADPSAFTSSPEARPSLLAGGHLPANLRREALVDRPIGPNDTALVSDKPAMRDPDSRIGPASPRQMQISGRDGAMDLADRFREDWVRRFGLVPRPRAGVAEDKGAPRSRFDQALGETPTARYRRIDQNNPDNQEVARARRAAAEARERQREFGVTSGMSSLLSQSSYGPTDADGKPAVVIWLDSIRKQVQPPAREK